MFIFLFIIFCIILLFLLRSYDKDVEITSIITKKDIEVEKRARAKLVYYKTHYCPICKKLNKHTSSFSRPAPRREYEPSCMEYHNKCPVCETTWIVKIK